MRKHIPQAVAVALLVLGHDAAAGQQTPPAAPAAQAPRPAPVRSPEIHADRRVTFRLLAPKPGYLRLYCQVQVAGRQVFAPFDLNIGP